MFTFNEFISKYNGKKIDFDGAYQGQCVDLFRQYCKEVLGISQPKSVIGAADFWTNYDTDSNLKDNFEKVANSPTGFPQFGDVVVWNKKSGGGFGHIGVAMDGDVNRFKSFDQNWKSINVCEPIEHVYTNVYGWFKPKKKPEPITTDVPQALQKYGKGSLADLSSYIDLLREDSQNLATEKTVSAERFLLIQEVAQKLACSTEPGVIKAELDILLEVENSSQEAQKKLQKTIEEKDREIVQLNDDLKKLSDEIAQMKVDHSKQLETMQTKVDQAITQKTQAEAEKQKLSFIEQILRLFTKGKK